MKYHSSVIALAALLALLLGAASAVADEADDAARRLANALSTESDPRAIVNLITPFVTTYPDHARASAYLNIAVINLTGPLANPREAVEMSQKVVERATKYRFEAQKVLATALGKSGDVAALRQLQAIAFEGRTLEYWDVRAFADAFFYAAQWRESLELLDRSLELSTAESLTKELGPKGWSADQIASLADRRATPAAVMKARVLIELGDTEAAATALDFAEAKAHMTFFGIRDEQVNVVRGALLVKNGRFAEAMDVLAPDAVMGHDAEALDLMRRAWIASGAPEATFDAELVRRATSMARPAPDFTVVDYRGRKVSLSDLRGKVVLLNFWFPFCGPCRQELPAIKDMYARLRDRGFEILCFDVLSEQAAAEKFIAEKELPYRFVQEGTANGPVSLGQWKVTACPTNFLIDRQGKVVWYHLDYTPGSDKEMERRIISLLEN